MSEQYTIVMALEDYIPVILAGIGFYYIARMIDQVDARAGKMAYLAVLLITLGGASKATWKLIIAGTGTDLVWLANCLFIFLGPGFTLMAYALWSANQVMAGKAMRRQLWLTPFIVIIVFFVLAGIAAAISDTRGWFFILLTLTSLANIAVSFMLIRQSWRQGLKVTVVLFTFNLLAVFALNGLARQEQTVAQQWLEQGLQTLSQLAFVLAAWQLSKQTLRDKVARLAPN